jgi:hypothetical protein
MCYVKVSLLLVIVVSFAAFHFTDFRLVARRQVKGRITFGECVMF